MASHLGERERECVCGLVFFLLQSQVRTDDAAAGLMADVAGSLIWVPNDVVKQRCQVSPGTSSTAAFKVGRPFVPQCDDPFLHTLTYMSTQAILRTDGPLGLYRGYAASLAVYGPFVSIYFAAVSCGPPSDMQCLVELTTLINNSMNGQKVELSFLLTHCIYYLICLHFAPF